MDGVVDVEEVAGNAAAAACSCCFSLIINCR